MKKVSSLLILLSFVFSACQSQNTVSLSANPTATQRSLLSSPTPPAFAPQPGDSHLTRAKAFPQSIDLLTVGTNPLELEVVISGYLPTPCHELRVNVSPPDEANNIYIELYSVAPPNTACAQVLRSFNTSIRLSGYASGSYWVWVNGERIGNFDV